MGELVKKMLSVKNMRKEISTIGKRNDDIYMIRVPTEKRIFDDPKSTLIVTCSAGMSIVSVQ